MAFHFARKLTPKYGPSAAGEYARHMCVIWGFLLLMLSIDILAGSLNIPIGALIGRNRIVQIAGASVLLLLGNIWVKQLVGRIPELRTVEGIERHHQALSQRRKILVLVVTFGTLAAVLGIVAARQFLGLFGGL